MNSKANLPSLLGFVFLVSVAQAALGDPAPCDPNHVLRSGKVWQVLPTGTDDTANLQCAFDQAVTVPGSTVLLAGGTYYTGQVAVSGFVGTFRGIGMNHTIVKTLDRTLYVTYTDFFLNPPTPESGSNPWPSILAFVGGDIVISDLSFYTTENSWTTGWTWTGLGLTVYELAQAFVVVGPVVSGQNYTEANAEVYRVRVEGLPRDGTLYGYNVITGIYYEGFFGAPYGQTLPLSGKFDAHDSQFRQVGCGTCAYNLYDSRVSIARNRSTDSYEAMDIGQAVNTVYRYADNSVFNASAQGLLLWGPFDSSTLLVKDNVFTGIEGLYLDDTVTFSGDMKCGLLNNGVENMTDVGIYLGTGTKDCLVVCKASIDTVKNLGTDNKLINCQAVSGNEIP
jgi:hypothetical protein